MFQEYIIGIDEVGRGSLAGPVTVAAVAYPRGFRVPRNSIVLRDSKRLTPHSREAWFRTVQDRPDIIYAVASVSANVIDRINISQAANQAATKAFQKCANQLDEHIDFRVFLDGGLYLHKSVFNEYRVRPKTVIRGDEKYNAIRLASIVAKVTRDRYMARRDEEFKVYGFSQHKGYGTEYHRRAVHRHGPSKLHRLTFIKN